MEEDLQLVEEAYYGKLPEFIQMEEWFNKLIERVNKEGARKCNPNKFKEVREIEAIFKKLFGFRKACIYFEAYAQPNAYTYSMNVFLVCSDKKYEMVKKEHGFYDTSGITTLGVFSTVGMFELNLTARQWIAIILHEIGHNFDTSAYHKIDYWLYNIQSLGMAGLEIKANKDKIDDFRDEQLKKHEKESNKYYDNSKRREKADRKYDKAMEKAQRVGPLKVLLLPIRLAINTISDISILLSLPGTTISILAGKKGELFADSFATAYGYGHDLVDALNILDKYADKFVKSDSKIANFFRDLAESHYEFLVTFADVHGTTTERCRECIEKLEWDLKHNDFQPELREELEKEIASMWKLYKSFYKMEPGEKYKLTKIWRNVVLRLFGGRPNLIRLFKRHKV